jgi:hypothetical protein
MLDSLSKEPQFPVRAMMPTANNQHTAVLPVFFGYKIFNKLHVTGNTLREIML